MNVSAHPQSQLHADQGERVLAAQDLPLVIGGAAADIVAIGAQDDRELAVLGYDEHGLYVEPGEGPHAESPARLNAQPLRERTRLSHGDVLGAGDSLIFFLLDGPRPRLRLEAAQQAATQPPVQAEEEPDAAEDDAADSQSIRRAAFRPLLRTGDSARAGTHPWRWSVAAALGVLAAVLWLLMTSSPVQVTAEPRDAQVDFSGAWLELNFGGNYLLRPGRYTLVASRQGYETARQPVTVTDEQNQRLRVSLNKLPGQVRIDTGGVQGMLEVDGKPVGAVPGEYELAAGEHTVVVRAPRYVELSQQVEVQGGGTEQRVALQLTPAFSAVTIESKPSGARVTVDGRQLGVTPLTTELDAGARTLALAADGFRRWESTIEVQPDTPQTIGPIELGLPDGRLLVATEPSGAAVAVAGRYRGRTPLELSLAPGLSYAVQLTRDGYQPEQRSLRVQPAGREDLRVQLTPILGEVRVQGTPADAQLFVEGQSKGAANQTLQLPSTQLEVQIRREGYLPFSTTVTPQPGVARVVEYRLLTGEQARAARIPPTLTTKAGGQLRLMPTGNYQMGSPRREPGARTNESQHAVTLQRPFYLGVKEVTNEEYLKYQPDHLSGIVKNRSLDQDDHPVVNVSWREAAEFCNWLSQQEGLPPAYEQRGDHLVLATPVTTGYRLPTEAEWEWGARHQPTTAALRRYQWGQSLPIPRNAGNYADTSSLLVLESGLKGYSDGFVTTAPVGSFAANALGLYDMDGNVSEWVNDFYTVYRELEKERSVDPTGPENGDLRVIRGANWRTTDITDLRLAWRDSFGGKAQHMGFRVARYAE